MPKPKSHKRTTTTTASHTQSAGSARHIIERRTLDADGLRRELLRAYREGDLDDERLADLAFRLEQLGLGHIVREVCNV